MQVSPGVGQNPRHLDPPVREILGRLQFQGVAQLQRLLRPGHRRQAVGLEHRAGEAQREVAAGPHQNGPPVVAQFGLGHRCTADGLQHPRRDPQAAGVRMRRAGVVHPELDGRTAVSVGLADRRRDAGPGVAQHAGQCEHPTGIRPAVAQRQRRAGQQPLLGELLHDDTQRSLHPGGGHPLVAQPARGVQVPGVAGTVRVVGLVDHRHRGSFVSSAHSLQARGPRTQP